MFKRKRKNAGSDVETELNLVPIMNLFTVLIPFLLLSAAFIQVNVVNASVPAIADGSDPERENEAIDKRPVVINVIVDSKGYQVTASGDEMTPKELDAYKKFIQRTSDGYNTQALTDHLMGVKLEHPESDTLILIPGQKVRYAEIIRVMDASRKAPSTIGKAKYLFPKVVVASLIQ